MVWPAVAAAAVSVVGGMIGGSKADSAARSAGREQRKLTLIRRNEEIGQRKLEQGNRRGFISAGVAASNLQMSGTAASYLKTEEYQNMRELAWMEKSRDQEARAIRKGAQGAGDALRIGGITSGLSQAISAWGST